jgi:uncharacterized protein YndB with AHSA1/START domain
LAGCIAGGLLVFVVVQSSVRAWTMSETEVRQTECRLELTRSINAPPAAVFTVITDPAGHVQIDGSGMLVAAQNSSPLTRVGDSFVMNMDREPLGDLPLGKYQVRNTVTAFVPDELFEWNVGGVDQPPFGHVYGYRLEPGDDGATVVTLYVDWTGVRAGSIRDRFPIVPAHMLEKSLDNLDRICSETRKTG